MKKPIKNNSFVFYATALETVEELEKGYPELGAELLKAMVEYGIYGEYDTSNPIINSIMAQFTFSVDKAKSRYEIAKENGSKGGRPKKLTLSAEELEEMKKELGTWKKVAEELDVTEDGLRKYRKTITENQKNQKNLNVNVNVNDNVNENVNTTTTTTEDIIITRSARNNNILAGFEEGLTTIQWDYYNDLRESLKRFDTDAEAIVMDNLDKKASTIISILKDELKIAQTNYRNKQNKSQEDGFQF